MTDVPAHTKARATMHLKVTRANGTVEEYDVPVETDLTKDQVLALIAQHNVAARRCGKPAIAAVHVADDKNGVLMCDAHLQSARAAQSKTGALFLARPAIGECVADADPSEGS